MVILEFTYDSRNWPIIRWLDCRLLWHNGDWSRDHSEPIILRNGVQRYQFIEMGEMVKVLPEVLNQYLLDKQAEAQIRKGALKRGVLKPFWHFGLGD